MKVIKLMEIYIAVIVTVNFKKQFPKGNKEHSMKFNLVILKL